jgi:S-methylmethionine-dependent homocysteine/selenocysteine methylase
VKPLCGLPPEKLAEAIALEHWRTALYFGGTAWLVFALWVLVRLRTGAAIERVACLGAGADRCAGLGANCLWA